MPVTSSVSLFELIKQSHSSLNIASVSSSNFQLFFRNFLELLSQQENINCIWLKFSEIEDWQEEFVVYCQQDNWEKIYLYSFEEKHEEFAPTLKDLYAVIDEKITVSFLDSRWQLDGESFFLFLSSQFSGAILTREIETIEFSENSCQIICTFEPSIVSKILEELTGNKYLLTEKIAPETKFLNDLLLKQINSNYSEIHQKNTIAQEKIDKNNFTQSFGLKDEFLNHLVRELRSPITQMKTALSLLESKQLKSEQRQRYLEVLSRECERQNSLIGGLLELVELDSYAETGTNCAVKLADLVPGIISTYQPLAQEKGIQLGYTIPSGFPAVACPHNWLRQIILNLLSNSLQFTPTSGKVFVQANQKNDKIELLFTDTGIGIEAQDIPKIFNSFYRGKNAINNQITGAGLGLTIVKYLLWRCHGSISVASKPGKGTVFKILLPIYVAT